MDKIKIAIIGGGPGGYAAAFLAADLGMEVTLIDKEKILAAYAFSGGVFHPRLFYILLN